MFTKIFNLIKGAGDKKKEMFSDCGLFNKTDKQTLSILLA